MEGSRSLLHNWLFSIPIGCEVTRLCPGGSAPRVSEVLSGCSSPSAHTVPGACLQLACLPCPKRRFLDFCPTSWKCRAVSRRKRAIKLQRWPLAAPGTKPGTYFATKGTKFVRSLDEFRRARRWSCIFYRKSTHAGLSGTFVERIFAYDSEYAVGLTPVFVQFSLGLWRWQDGVEKPACLANGALPYFVGV